MTDKNQLRILFAEDLPSDFELALLELRKGGLKFDHQRVETRDDFIKALKEFKPDMVISDYLMPSFNGLQALKETKEYDPLIPFILCTGSVNEEIAVECMKAGATDYVIKEHMTRLPFAAKEALIQTEIQKEKRAAELLLKDSEEKLQSIFSAAPVGIGLVVNRVLMEVNDTLCSLTGYGRNELIGRSSEVFYPTREEYERVGTVKYQQIKEKGTGSLETTFKTKRGNLLNVILSSTPLDRNDNSKGVTFTVLDITERKRSEETLRESQHLFQTLSQVSPVGIFRTKPDGYTTYVNPKWMELSGLTFEEAMGFGWLKAVHPDDREKLQGHWNKDVQDQSTSFAEYRFLKPDGIVTWVIGNAVPEMINNELVGYVGTITDITSRKTTEEALQISEEKFRSIAENLSDVIFLTDIEGILNYVSPSAGILGYSEDEFAGRFFGEFLVEGELEKAMPLFRNALNSVNLANTVQLLFKRKDGSTFFAELSGSVFYVGNEIKGVLGLLRDVSDKVARENELRKLSQAVEQNPSSIVITDTDGKIEYANPSFCEVTGYSKDELIGGNPRILSSGEKSKEEYKILWDTVKAGNEWRGEFHNKKKNGDLYWERASISPIKNERNEITHFLGIKEDITLHKILQEKTFESEKRYRELFMNNPVPTYIFDENTLEFVEVNEAATENYGYSRNEFSSMTLRDLRQPEDVPELLESVKELGKEVFYSVNMHHRRKNGVVFPVEITSHSLPEKNGRKTRLVIAIDITERVRAAEQMKLAKETAEASDKLKSTFLNNISHEVRTPLNGILGFAEIMSQPDLTDDEKKESLSMLFESSDRLLNTISNYVDISLLTSGTLTVNSKEFFPVNVLKKNFDSYNQLCSDRNLVLFLKVPEKAEKISVNSDPEIFNKIICHFLNNALKFTEEGTITYGFEVQQNNLEFFVKDTGIGIGKESISNVFDHFVKEDRGPTKLSEGSGLGLSIAKGMTDLIGGTIRVESELNGGSCFYLTIPFIKPADSDSSVKSGIEYQMDNTCHTIMVAEDDDTNFYYLNALLKHATGARIIHAVNGREAIELFKANPDISLILMDIKMPEIDGLEATRQIKLLKPAVPIIAITAYAMSGDEERVLAAGCDGYLSKPINKKSLLDKIAEFVNI